MARSSTFLLAVFLAAPAFAADRRGCREAEPSLPTDFAVPQFAANHREFQSYCSSEDEWDRMRRRDDPDYQRMRAMVKRENYCFVIVKGLINELYAVPGTVSFSSLLSEAEDVVQRLRTFDNRLGASTPFTKPFQPSMPSGQGTAEAAKSLITQLRSYQEKPPWRNVPGMKGQRCDKFILHCHSKGGSTCYNLGADDVLDASPGNRDWVKSHVAMVVNENAVVGEGAPLADIAVAYCEQSDDCMKKLLGDPQARADYELIRPGAEQRRKRLKDWEEFKAARYPALRGRDVVQKLILSKAEWLADFASGLARSGILTVTSSYVDQRRELVHRSDNPLKERTYYVTSQKAPEDFVQANVVEPFAEFQASPQGHSPGDGITTCRGQVDPQVGHWLMDTKDMWHTESNTPMLISGSWRKCRLGYTHELYLNIMRELRRTQGFDPPVREPAKTANEEMLGPDAAPAE